MIETILFTSIIVVCILTAITFYEYLKEKESEEDKIQFK